MKKILLSLGTLVFIGAIAASATGAFFSDTETSSGNSFTAGAIDLTVDSTSHYNGNTCTQVTAGIYQWQGQSAYPVAGTPCSGTWSATNLGPTNQFFNFPDIKPGDSGEDTISLHVDNNPAWACADIQTTSNAENVATGPELAAGDTVANGNFDGELAQNTSVFAWLDNGAGGGIAGDNIWQAGEPKLYGPVTLSATLGTTTLPLADSVTNGGAPLAAGATNYIGLAWCAGTMNVSVPGTITCSGSSMGNNVQTDSATANVTLRVSQQRNQPNFTCVTPIVVGANDLETVLANSATDGGKWYWYNDTTDVLDNTLGAFVAGPATPPLGSGSAKANPLADSSGRTLFTNGGFGGTTLASISNLSYGYYQPSGVGSASEAPFLRFNVDFAGSASYQGSLVYVPSANGSVTQNAWQTTGNIAAPGTLWNYSGGFWPAGVTTVANTVTGTTNRTWASILADYPAIRMHPLFPQIGMRVGEPGPTALTANLDNFSITILGVTKTFDFGN